MNALIAAAILASPLNWDTLSEPMDWDMLGGEVQSVEAPTQPSYYAQAYAKYQQGRPMVVFLTAKWCASCAYVSGNLPAIWSYGHYVRIDIDEEPELAKSLAGGDGFTIPRVIIFQKGRPTRTYVGSQIAHLPDTGQEWE